VTLVLDTNVIVAGMLSPYGPPGRLVDMLIAGAIRLAYDDRTLLELRDVLLRPRFALPEEDVEDLLERIRLGGLHVAARPLRLDWPDPDDAPFVEIAAEAGVPLVSGNARLVDIAREVGVSVYSPREALDIVAIAPD